MINLGLLVELGVEFSAIQGSTIRDWVTLPVGEEGWTIGARDLLGGPTLAVDTAGNFARYHLMKPEAAMAALAAKVAERPEEPTPLDAGQYSRVDRLGWEFVFRSQADGTVEMWSAANQRWQPGDLLGLFPDQPPLPLMPLSSALAEEWMARAPQNTPGLESHYYLVATATGRQALWQFKRPGAPEQWRRRVAGAQRLEVLPATEVEALRSAGHHFVEVSGDVFRSPLGL